MPAQCVGGVVVSAPQALVVTVVAGGVGCVFCVVLLGFRLLGTTEWTRAILGPRTTAFAIVVCVVIVKLSAY